MNFGPWVNEMVGIRQPAVAGTFYPAEPGELRTAVSRFVDDHPASGVIPKAIIAPHAGYVFSGPIAGTVYARLKEGRGRIRRVVLIGPSHRAGFTGLAISTADSFSTPLGEVAVDRTAVDQLLTLPQVQVLDFAHGGEHCLEVHLPFLQHVLDDFRIVPIVVGDACAEDVAAALEKVWDGDETLIVVSSDLSHYLDYDRAWVVDHRTSQAIEALRWRDIGSQEACGCRAVAGLLLVASRYGLRARTIDLRNSGDTAGPRDSVVGYGAFVFE